MILARVVLVLFLLSPIIFAQGGNCPVTSIQLPIEVIGLDGTVNSVAFTLPATSTGPFTLSMRIHGLKYETEASLQINSSAWFPINSSTVTILGLGQSFGGIGGGYRTLDMTIPMPTGAIVSGYNLLTFRFNKTNGVISGFRILAFNILDVNGSALVPASTFVWDDPTVWVPPLPDAPNIAVGKQLWFTGTLTSPIAVKAHCTDCHAQDGRDLKYFNYSNYSIRARAMFHGLTPLQGDQIASYIRSLNTPNPGRPWNPPYQPGPGLDSKPVTQWAAGAGLDAVLQNDSQMVPYLMPGGSTANWSPGTPSTPALLSAREQPIIMQFPDWNSWLPVTAPIDGFGSLFTASQDYTNYLTIRKALTPNNAATYVSQKSNIQFWTLYDRQFFDSMKKPWTDPAWGNPAYALSLAGLRMWNLVKQWEVNQEFGLEGMSQSVFGPLADSRAWYGQEAFFASPNMMQLPHSTVGNGLPITVDYMSLVWYHVLLVQNYSNNRGTRQSPSIDWPYSMQYVIRLGALDQPYTPTGTLMLLWLIKGLQASENGNGPEFGSNGWAPNVNNPSRLIEYGLFDPAMDPKVKSILLNVYLVLWFNAVSSYTPNQFYTGKWANASEVPNPAGVDNQGNNTPGFGNYVVYMIPRFAYCGVSPGLLSSIVNWGKTIWPLYPKWGTILNAACIPNGGNLNCTW